MEGKRYPSDMTDEEWAILEPLIPDSRSGGRPRFANMHEVMNSIFYVLREAFPGVSCPRSSHLGRRCITTFASGEWMVPGK